MRKRKPVLSVTMYVLSALLAIYTGFALADCVMYINEMISTGQLTFWGNIYGIANFFMSNCASYIFFCVAFIALGRILQSCYRREAGTEDVSVKRDDDDDDKLADWFGESS